jgi:hypothetical protein
MTSVCNFLFVGDNWWIIAITDKNLYSNTLVPTNLYLLLYVSEQRIVVVVVVVVVVLICTIFVVATSKEFRLG